LVDAIKKASLNIELLKVSIYLKSNLIKS